MPDTEPESRDLDDLAWVPVGEIDPAYVRRVLRERAARIEVAQQVVDRLREMADDVDDLVGDLAAERDEWLRHPLIVEALGRKA